MDDLFFLHFGLMVDYKTSCDIYINSCEGSSSDNILTTKTFTHHVHLKQQDIYASGKEPKKETVFKRDMLGERELPISSQYANYRIKIYDINLLIIYNMPSTILHVNYFQYLETARCILFFPYTM